jgi:hypothetical protein
LLFFCKVKFSLWCVWRWDMPWDVVAVTPTGEEKAGFDLGPNTEQDHGPDSRVYRCSQSQPSASSRWSCGTVVHTHSLVAESRDRAKRTVSKWSDRRSSGAGQAHGVGLISCLTYLPPSSGSRAVATVMCPLRWARGICRRRVLSSEVGHEKKKDKARADLNSAPRNLHKLEV